MFIIIETFVDEDEAPLTILGLAATEEEARTIAVTHIQAELNDDHQIQMEEHYKMSYVYGDYGSQYYVWIEDLSTVEVVPDNILVMKTYSRGPGSVLLGTSQIKTKQKHVWQAVKERYGIKSQKELIDTFDCYISCHKVNVKEEGCKCVYELIRVDL